MSGIKEDDSQNINVTDSGSPKIEDLVEAIDPPPTTQSQLVAIKTYRRGMQNGLQTKRPKLETTGDDYEHVDMTSSAHFLPDAPPQHDDCELFGRSIAAQLRQMPRSQKIIAQRLMSEVCFRGQIQALNIMNNIGTQPATVFQQLQQPVLPPYAFKPVHINNNKTPEYFNSHHPFANVRQQAFVSPVNLGSAAVGGVSLSSYQGKQQHHQEHGGTSSHSHNMSHSDVKP